MAPRRSGKTVLGGFALLLMFISGGLIAINMQQPLTGLLADHATATGEQQQIILPDNTQLMLNSRTVVDIDFTAQQRRIHLHSGEVYIRSGHNPDEQRPLLVITNEGSLRALGTAFVVQRQNDATRLEVTEAAVMARPENCNTNATELARYRVGIITVAPEVAQLRVTATLPITAPDKALTALTDALPIHVSRRTGLWLHIEPANTD